MFYQNDRLAIFVDGPNIYATARKLGLEIDYKEIIQAFSKRGRLVRATYVTSIVESESHNNVRPLIDWLQYNGWRVVLRPVKIFEDDDNSSRILKNIYTDLVVEMIKLSRTMDHIVLFGGSNNYAPAIKYLMDQGVHVTLVSSVQTKPAMISDELRRLADSFIDIEDFSEAISRK